MIETAASCFNAVFPLFFLIVGVLLVYGLVSYLRKSVRDSFYSFDRAYSREIQKEYRKRKNDEEAGLEQDTLSLDELQEFAEKPKRGLFHLGADGEITPMYSQHDEEQE